MKKIKVRFFLIKIIIFYQKYISFDTGFLGFFKKKPTCVFYPSCSEYTKQAFLKYGVIKGFFLGFRRILRCHPWQKNNFDPLK